MHVYRPRPRLRVERVRRYPRPAYPTIQVYAEHPELLLDHAPPRWLTGGLTLGALTAFVLAGASARGDAATTPAAAADESDTSARSAPVPQSQAAARETVSVAPVFVHGEGRGATGCVAISPPVFLSEAEALEIIWDELGREGLGFGTRPTRVPGLVIKPTPPSDPQLAETWAASPREEKPRALFFDAFSQRYDCGVLFVGEANYEEVTGEPQSFSTAMEYDTLGMAQKVAERLARDGRTHAGVFYDPLVSIGTDERIAKAYGEAQAEASTKAAELLRAQVREFVEWLKLNVKELPATSAPSR
jgi:hypothetical protein